MHKASKASVYSVIGLTALGVGYDFGLFGTPGLSRSLGSCFGCCVHGRHGLSHQLTSITT